MNISSNEEQFLYTEHTDNFSTQKKKSPECNKKQKKTTVHGGLTEQSRWLTEKHLDQLTGETSGDN